MQCILLFAVECVSDDVLSHGVHDPIDFVRGAKLRWDMKAHVPISKHSLALQVGLVMPLSVMDDVS